MKCSGVRVDGRECWDMVGNCWVGGWGLGVDGGVVIRVLGRG